MILLGVSCAVRNRSATVPEDRLFVTRKYVGNFIEYVSRPPEFSGNPHLVIITTTLDSLYGKISAYSKKCEFRPGDRLYIQREYQTKGVFGSWIYMIGNEGEAKVSYQVSEFRNGEKILSQSWY